MDFLSIRDGTIINTAGIEVILRGVNLGGWLMMEGYLLGGRNIAEHIFKKDIAKTCGKAGLRGFEDSFRRNFITAGDFANIKKMGANCIRLPFHYKIVTEKQVDYLDQAIDWAKEHNLYVILDLHAARGAQNADWHSDSTGRALLWENKKNQQTVYNIWRYLADRYKHESAIAGFDILNESVGQNTETIREVYINITKAIRGTGDQHIIFVEGNTWAQEFDFLGEPWDPNLTFSFHHYLPLEYTFNFVRQLRYPGEINGQHWNKKKIEQVLLRYKKLQERWRVPIYCGEFGINLRCSHCTGELSWVEDVMTIFTKWKVHYTYWTYKAVAGGIMPDGIYQYLANPDWVNRGANISGVETFSHLWPDKKEEIIASWQTKNFVENKFLSRVLAKYFRRK